MNELEIHKKIAHDLISIVKLDQKYFSNGNSVEVLSIILLLASKIKTRKLSKEISHKDFLCFAEDEINKINPNIWGILGQIFKDVSTGILNEIQIYLINSNVTIDHFFAALIFEEILYEQALYLPKFRREFVQPIEITDFILQLADTDRSMHVYNPFAGTASYGVEISKRHHYFGQEINKKTWAIGWIRLFLNKSYSFDYTLSDSILDWKCDRFDLIISTPPFGLNMSNSSSYEELLLTKGLSSLKTGGRIICLLSENFFFSEVRSQKLLRKHLLSEGYIEMIVSLPSNILLNTSIKTSILILNKNKTSDDITFVNGASFFIKINGRNKLRHNDLLNEIQNNGEKYIRHISLKEIAKNDFRLDASSYFFDKIVTPEGYSKLKLKDILTYNNNRIHLDKDLPVLSISDLKDNPFDSPVIYKSKDISKKSVQMGSVFYSNQDILLISPILKTLKPTYYKTNDSSLLYSSNIAGFYLKDSMDIDLTYFIYELNADYIKKQIEGLSIGTIQTYIRIKDFLNIEILKPHSLDSQKLISTRAKEVFDANKIKEYGLENYIKIETEKFKQILNIKTHRIRPFLSGLSDNIDLLMDEFITNECVKHDDEIIPNYSIKNLLENMKECLSDVKGIFNELTNDLNIGAKEIFDIIDFIKKYAFNHKKQNMYFTIEIGLDNESFLLKKNKKISTKIYFNKDNLKEILDLIIENAEKHGFSEEQKITDKIIITIAYLPDSDYISLSIKNNGLAMQSNFTENDLFTNGVTSGKTGNTGVGGFRIKEIAEKLGGKVHLINNPQSKYPVEIQLYLPIYL